MESNSSAWVIVFLVPGLAMGIFFTFFPEKVVKTRAKSQENLFKALGLSGDDVDKLPFYSALFGERYSQRLKRAQENPQDFSGLIAWIRLIGVLTLLLSLIVLCLFVLALKSGSIT